MKHHWLSKLLAITLAITIIAVPSLFGRFRMAL